MTVLPFWRKGVPSPKAKCEGVGHSGTAIPSGKNGWENQLSPLDAWRNLPRMKPLHDLIRYPPILRWRQHEKRLGSRSGQLFHRTFYEDRFCEAKEKMAAPFENTRRAYVNSKSAVRVPIMVSRERLNSKYLPGFRMRAATLSTRAFAKRSCRM